MKTSAIPVIKDIVLIGGGHAHVTVLKRFGMQPVPGVRLTLISPDSQTPYSGMLPGLIADHYTYDEAHVDLVPLCRFADACFVNDDVAHVDPIAKLVYIGGRPPVPYDLLSINSGSIPDPGKTSGATGRVIPVKPVADFLIKWDELKQRVLEEPRRRIGAIGAGAGGVELVLSAQFALRNMLRQAGIAEEPDFHVVTQGKEVLSTHNASVRRKFQDILSQRGVMLHTGFSVDAVSDDGVHHGDRAIELDDILWVTGADADPWIRQSGFKTDERGFLIVNPTLQSVSHPDVFGVGDIASVVDFPRPKSGVFAVRQGPPLEANLRRAVLGKHVRQFRPQSHFLSLVSTGDKHAVASRGTWCLAGDWVWRWKDHIDRTFMDTFNKLPDMTAQNGTQPPQRLPPALATPELDKHIGPLDMRCGGCGAKVGGQTLERIINQLSPSDRDGVVVGLDAPDDAALIEIPPGKLLVQTVDSFRTLVDDPFVFGMITANHCLSDVFAMGGTAHSALAIVTVPPGLPEKTEALVVQLMAGAGKILEDANCALIGGHTGEGAELSLGFAINGVVSPGAQLSKGGIRSGDALVLTKPLGTGTLFAANMRAKAKGRWIESAIASATQSNRQAAAILLSCGATACTDVTGFGLAGHLKEMATASELQVEIDLAAIPTFVGAREMIDAGIVSTLHATNKRAVESSIRYESGSKAALAEILFDPQTAGGLLASVPSEQAGACVEQLRAEGYQAATIIGRATNEPSLGEAAITLKHLV